MRFLGVLLFSLIIIIPSFAQNSDRDSRDALLALREQRYEDALMLSSRAQMSIDNKSSSAYLEVSLTKSQALLQLKRHEEALSEALALRKIASQEPRLMQLIGEIYYAMGRGNDALPYFIDYIAYNPTGDVVGRIYYYMGEIYLLQGRYHQAEIAFMASVYHNPNADRWWFRLGYAREQVATTVAGSEKTFALTSAKTAYERALQINPSFNEAKSRIAVLQRSLR